MIKYIIIIVMMAINILACLTNNIGLIASILNTIPLIGITYIFYKWDLFNRENKD